MPEQINFEEELKNALDRRPFAPFFITLTSGERLEITERHQVAIGEGNTMAVLKPRAGGIFIRKNQVVSIDVPEMAD
jgi:hypothetical protein